MLSEFRRPKPEEIGEAAGYAVIVSYCVDPSRADSTENHYPGTFDFLGDAISWAERRIKAHSQLHECSGTNPCKPAHKFYRVHKHIQIPDLITWVPLEEQPTLH